MGWAVAADVPVVTTSDSSITVALIAALGTVVVALIGLAAQWMSRSARTSQSPPTADPELGAKVAVVDARGRDDRRTVAQLDRHVDGIGDQVEKLRWEMDDMKVWREQHIRGDDQ